MARRVFITAAEVSGDQHAGHLIHSLRQIDPDIVVEGHGGADMRDAGAILHHETVSKAAMSFHAIARIREMSRVLKWTREYLKSNKPDLQICVDSPALNFHFAKAAHELGIPVLYYVAPQLWAWREGRMKKLRRWVDRVACILPFEEEYFRGHGVNATFVGHPLFDELPTRNVNRNGARFPDRPPVIGIIPGSRTSEVNSNLKPLLDVAAQIRKDFPGTKFLIPTTAATNSIVHEMLRSSGQGMFLAKVDAFDEFVPQCDLCLCKSGTSTLHVASYGVPMIVVYRVNPWAWHSFGRWLIKTRTFSLVNILAGRDTHIVPEFVPWYGSGRGVSDLAIDYLRHPEKLAAQSDDLNRLIRSLDKPGASMNVARLAMEMMKTRPSVTASR